MAKNLSHYCHLTHVALFEDFQSQRLILRNKKVIVDRKNNLNQGPNVRFYSMNFFPTISSFFGLTWASFPLKFVSETISNFAHWKCTPYLPWLPWVILFLLYYPRWPRQVGWVFSWQDSFANKLRQCIRTFLKLVNHFHVANT